MSAETSKAGKPPESVVSVVIPVIRAGAYLQEAVDSVRTQTYNAWELLVVDNGATEPLDCLPTDPRIRVLCQRKRGTSWARNLGVAEARGRYIAFLDEDDLWLPTKLEQQVAALESNPQAGMVHTGYETIDASGSRVSSGKVRRVSYPQILDGRGGYVFSSVMARRDILIGGASGDVTLPHADDYRIVISILRSSEDLLLPETLTRYRFHGDNASRNYRLQCLETVRILQWHRRMAIEQHDIRAYLLSIRGTLAYRNGFSRTAAFYARDAWAQRDVSGAIRHWGNAATLFPSFGLRAVVEHTRSSSGI